MRIKRAIFYNKSLIVDEHNLKNLNKILVENFKRVTYKAFLKSDVDSIDFSSFDELLEYENDKKTRLDYIFVYASNRDYVYDLEITIGLTASRFPFEYNHTIKCTIDTDDNNFDILVTSKLLRCFESMKAWYWVLNKVAFLISFPITFGVLMLLYTLIRIGNIHLDFSKTFDFKYLISFFAIYMPAIYLLNKGFYWLFPIKYFKIGNETKRYTFIQRARGVIFGVIGLGIIVGCFVNLIS